MSNLKKTLSETPVLHARDIILRRFTLADAPAVLSYGSDEMTLCYLVWEGIQTLSAAEESITNYYLPNPGVFCIALKESNLCIGCIDVRLEEAHDKASFGYVLDRAHWGRGYMTQALGRVIKLCFDTLKLNRIESTHYEGNEASGRVMQKCGMTLEGKGIQEVKIKGIYHNVLHYAILRHD